MELRRHAFGAEDPRTLAAQAVLVNVLYGGTGRYSESLPLALQTWQVRSRVLGPEHRDTLESLDNYASALMWSGRLDDAIPLLRTCLAARRRVLGAGHPDTLVSINNLAHALTNHGDFSQATALFRQAIDAYRTAGPETELAISCANLASCLYWVGKLEEADDLLQTAMQRAIERLGADHYLTDRLRWYQVRVWIDQGQVKQAVDLGGAALGFRRRIYPEGHNQIATALMDLGRGLVLLGKFTEAEEALSKSLAILGKSNPFLPHYPAWVKCWYGASLVGQHRYAEAEGLLLAAEQGLRAASTCPRRHYQLAAEQLVKLYVAWGKPDEAGQWQKRLAAIGESQGPSGGKGGGANGSGR